MSDIELFSVDNAGNYSFFDIATPTDIIDIACKILEQRIPTGDVMADPTMVKDYLTFRLANLEHEVFSCLFLNNQHQLICFEEIFRGTINATAVFPREIVKQALKHNAAAVVFVHNHPSGVSEPSESDKLMTQGLTNALRLVDVRVLDHIIVAGPLVTSFAEQGLI